MMPNCKMNKSYACIALLCCTVLFAVGCSRIGDDEPLSANPAMANLDISVAFSTGVQGSRALTPAPDGDYDDEYMKCLRIIIVRPDGTVEHNRFIDFDNLYVEKTGDVGFQVVADEWKQIYLFANEQLTRIKNIQPNGIVSGLETYNLSRIEVGKPFPDEELAEYRLQLTGPTEELTGPLPMSECHRVWVPKEENYACDLFITRAAVKFSFVFDNRSGRERRLTELEIHKLLGKEYYLPRNTVYADPQPDGVREITSFDVPSFEDSNNGYYTFSRYFNQDLLLPADEKTALPPVYLLEGKYTDSAGETGQNGPRNYSVRILLKDFGAHQGLGDKDEWQQWEYFSDLSRLPRNTHVVVYATIGKSDIEWTVEIIPYTQVPLDPVFGLD